MDAAEILLEIADEYKRATSKYGAFHSAHEGLSVLQEEVKELQDWVYMKESKQDKNEMRKEAIQVAAMALKFAVMVCE